MSVRVALAQIRGEPFAADGNRALTVETAARAFADGADIVACPS